MIIQISESTRPGKKWMAKVEGERKTVHFGQRGASDYAINHDDARRASYIARHGSKEDWHHDSWMAFEMAPLGEKKSSCSPSGGVDHVP